MIARVARWTLAAVLAAALAPAAAAAHATIVATTPQDTSVIKSAPRAVTLTWSEPVDFGDHAVKLLDARGKEIRTEPARHGPGGARTAVLTLPPGLKNGTYVISWRVVSADSHPVSGAFSFSIGAPTSVLFAADGSSSAAVRAVDAVGRGIAFLGLAVTIGGAFVLFGLWPEGPANARGRRLLWGGIGALLFGSLVVLLLQGPYASGGSLGGAFSPSLVSFSLSTRFGHALVARIVLTLVFAGLVVLALRRGARDPAIAVPAGACVLGLIGTWTLTDHSRTGVQTWLGVPVASLHLLAMTLWFGGLVLLLGCVLGRPHVSLEPVVPRFSRLALPCFAVLGASGLYLAWRQVGTFPALPDTDFGKLLLLKAAIVAAIVGLAFLSRRAVERGGGDLGRRLRGSVAGEACLGVAALGVTATLVNTAPARVSYIDPVNTTVAGPAGTRVQVSVNPAKQGANVLDVYLVKRDGMLLIVPELTAKLIPPGSSGALDVPLGSAEPGHYVASRMSAPFPAKWTLRLRIRTSEIDETAVDVPVRIRVRLALATAAAFALLAPAASAHVTLIPAAARPGETPTLTFRVVNERDAATTKIQVFVPAGVKAEPGVRRGWSATQLGSQVDWTADSPEDAITGDASLDFPLKAGPLPKADQLVFKVLQSYDDGTVVRWIQDPSAGADRPAPVLQLTATGRPHKAGGSSSAAGWALLAVLAAAALGGVALVARRRWRR